MMKVEEAEPAKQYRFEVAKEEILIDEHLIPYFKTISNLLEDLGGADPKIAIPITSPDVTPELMRIMVHFYEVYKQGGITAVNEAINDEMSDNELYREWTFLHSDEHEMVALARAADFLDASELLVFVMDEIYKELEALSPLYLKKRYDNLMKRKTPEEAEVEDNRPVRLQYIREMQIQAILSTMLPNTLARGIDKRIEKYPAMMIGNLYMTFIRAGDGSSVPLFFPHYTPYNFGNEDESLASLRRGSRNLYTSALLEVSCGDIFFTILEKTGSVSAYGELTYILPIAFNSPYRGSTIKEDPFPFDCLAIWSDTNLIIALTKDSVYSFGRWDRIGGSPGHPSIASEVIPLGESLQKIEQFRASSIITVASGPSHTFFLTRDHLYGCGLNDRLVLGIQTDSPKVWNPTQIDAFNGERVEKIWTGKWHSLVVTNKNSLYVCGNNGNSKLGIPGNNEEEGANYLWTKITLPANLPRIEILTGTKYSSFFVAGNHIYQTGAIQYGGIHADIFEDITTFSLVTFDEGTIRELLCEQFYMLVLTTSGIYYIGHPKAALDDFGGSDSLVPPYKLRIEVVEEERSSRSNKRPRISCQLCSAYASYVNTAKNAFFCSGYCLHKSLGTSRVATM